MSIKNKEDLVQLMQRINDQDPAAFSENVTANAKAVVNDAKNKIQGGVNKLKNTVKDKAKFPYVPFVKKALHQNFQKIAGKLRFNESTITVGNNFIETIIEYKKLKNPEELNRFSYNRNIGLNESVIESTFNCIIESYGRKLRKITASLNEISGYNEDYFSSNNTKLMNEFEREIDNSTPEKLNDKIANRVEEATKNFIEKRNEEQERIKSIYNAAQEINKSEDQSEEMKNAANEAVKINLSDLRNKPVPLYEAMVVGLATMAVKDDEYKKLYLKEDNTINMDRIIDDVSAIYAVMEECNVYGLINIDKEFIHDFISSLK